MSEIDPIVKAAVDARLAEVEHYGIQAERMPEGARPWLYEAAMVGVSAMREAEFQRATLETKDAIMREEEARRQRYRSILAAIKLA